MATASDLQAIIAASHAALANASVRRWLDWVPSDSNCSDGLSRDGAKDAWTANHGLLPEKLRLPRWLTDISEDLSVYLNIIANRGL